MSGLLQRSIEPMKATSSDDAPTGDNWVYELKWDGMRIIATIDGDDLKLQSRNLLDVTPSFPELAGLIDAAPGLSTFVLDGEVVAFDADGQPSFNQLQHRMHVVDPSDAARRSKTSPVSMVVFDLLHVDGNDLHPLPFSERRKLLEQLVENGPTWRLTDIHEGDPAILLDVVTSQGLEGLIAKQLTSTYTEGKRSSAWRKIKPRRRQEFVVGGWVTGEGRRSGTIGAFMVGHYDETGFRYAGRVGSGLNELELKRWPPLLSELARSTSPFVDEIPPVVGRNMHFVEPELVVEVAFAHWNANGHLRHPSYLGQRADIDPASVVREP